MKAGWLLAAELGAIVELIVLPWLDPAHEGFYYGLALGLFLGAVLQALDDMRRRRVRS